MNRKRAGNMFRAGFAALPMALAACGGGGDGPAVCTNAAACAIVGSAPVSAPAPVPAIQALSLAPRSLTVGDCTTNIPFIFSGGVGPYTVFTSDNFNVPVASPLQLGVGNSFYFTASVEYRRPAATTHGDINRP